MPRVLFTITYTVKPEFREEYLALSRQLKEHFASTGTKNYTVYELRGKRNQFAEVFQTGSLEEFDALEDNQNETTQELLASLERFLEPDGMKYTTLVEAQ